MNRSAGILLSVTSLPSRYGIGCLDSVAFRFVDCLAEAGQTYWQILPLGPTGFGESGDSPYQSFSAFAGNPYLISLEKLVEEAKAVCPNLHCQVYVVKNHFFGGHVTVTGLLTGKDLAEQLTGKELGERLLLSRTTLRSEGDLFLCGMTPDALAETLGTELCFVEQDGAAFLESLLGL